MPSTARVAHNCFNNTLQLTNTHSDLSPTSPLSTQLGGTAGTGGGYSSSHRYQHPTATSSHGNLNATWTQNNLINKINGIMNDHQQQ